MENMLIQHGVKGVIRLLIIACWKRHEHYVPRESVFSIWARVLEKYIDLIEQEAKEGIKNL